VSFVFYLPHNISTSSLSPTNIPSPSYTTSSSAPTSSPTSSSSPNVLAHNSVNNHPIVTRSKNRYFQTKKISHYFTFSHSTTVHNAMLSPSWLQAMRDEYAALLNNQT